MLYRSLKQYMLNQAEEYDLLAKITQHPDRPKPQRDVDQIFMLPGSQLNQAKLMSPYIRDKSVAFVGDGDAMALVFALLTREGVIDGPSQMVVLDFDTRIVDFINETARSFNIHDNLEAIQYNAIDPVPEAMRESFDVFYTNPPYGRSNRGKSGLGFLVRCMALCKSVNSSGIAVLPYRSHTWSAPAMLDIQSFMTKHGYVVADMLQGMHLYHLDDSPDLRSATVVFDRAERATTPYLNSQLPEEIVKYFYGSANMAIPRSVTADGSLDYGVED